MGAVIMLQPLPVLLLGSWGDTLSDRLPTVAAVLGAATLIRLKGHFLTWPFLLGRLTPQPS